MKLRTKKWINGVLIILTLFFIINLFMGATPNEEEKTKAISLCKKDKIQEKDCKAAKTDLYKVAIAIFLCFILVHLIRLFFTNEELLLVDKEVATMFYINWLEKQRKLSFPRGRDGKFQFEEYDSFDTDKEYRLILSFINVQSQKPFYAPIAIGKYYIYDEEGEKKIELKDGRGKLTGNIEEAYIFKSRGLKKPKDQNLTQENIALIKTIFDQMQTEKTQLKRAQQPEDQG